MCSCVHFSQRNSGRAIRWKKPKSTTSRRSGPFICPGAVLERTDSSTSSAFGPTNRRTLRRSGGITNCCAEHVVVHGLVRIWLLRIFGNGDGIVQRHHHCLVRIVRQEDGRKELVLRSGPVERSAQGVAAADLLGRPAARPCRRPCTRSSGRRIRERWSHRRTQPAKPERQGPSGRSG